jgi:hypothetical protein
VEKSDLARAYQHGKALVERHPESAVAHFALAYVLRYGGAMEESAHECEAAMAVDPGNFMLRSCSFTFDQLGNYSRALDFLQLDAGSIWVSNNLARHYIRDGKLAQARELAQKFSGETWAPMMTACIDNPSSANSAKLTREGGAALLANPDPEVSYVVAPDFLFCGQKDLAIRLVKNSIAGQEFSELLSAAKKCQSDFLAQRSQAAQ